MSGTKRFLLAQVYLSCNHYNNAPSALQLTLLPLAEIYAIPSIACLEMGHMRLRIWLQDAIHRGNNSNSEVILFPLFLDIGQNVTVLGVHANDKKMSSSWEEYIYFDGGFGFIGIGVRNRSRRNPLLMPIISVYFFLWYSKKQANLEERLVIFITLFDTSRMLLWRRLA